MFERKLLRCSFCGKDETQVAKLVAGPRVFICDSCTAAAARIMSGSDQPPPAERLSFLRRAWRFVRGKLQQAMERSLHVEARRS